MNFTETFKDPAIIGVFSVIISGAISYFLSERSFRHNLAVLKAQFKTDFVAEETARHFLSHEKYTDRSFDVLKKHLGGFSDDELRKILVRAGAIRTYRHDGSEWWRLLSRSEEYASKRGR